MKHSSIHYYIFIGIGFFSMKESLTFPSQAETLVQAIVLAAGKSTRFAMGSSKLAFPLCGREMVLYPVSLLESLSLPTIIVTGYQKDIVTQLIQAAHPQSVVFVEQVEQRGTGHAVMCTQTEWHAEHLLIINGDMPLITSELIQQLINEHCKTQATVSFVTAACLEYPHGYGRVINNGQKIQIIEARDFTGTRQEGQCINAGVYLINREFLQDALTHLNLHENSQEWYITDLIDITSKAGKKVHTIETDFDTIRGINTISELATAEKIIRERIITHWMKKGVYFEQPETTIIEHDVIIGPATRIGAGVHITKGSRIGARCTIGNHSTIDASTLADQVTILPHCVIAQSEIHDHATIGPFAHIRNTHSIHERATIGNFVEISNSTVGAYTKAKHLSYIGNAIIGERVNIGAGTITCNYDGVRKHVTTIKDNVKVGSNNCLIAPVVLEQNSMTAAGSVITQNVPRDALAIARAHQVNKENYTKRFESTPSFVAAAVHEK